MRQRVACSRCQAHRDLTTAPTCFVCSAESFAPVHPTAGDRDAIVDRVVTAAEAIDVVLYDLHTVGEFHRVAIELRLACRDLARCNREDARI